MKIKIISKYFGYLIISFYVFFLVYNDPGPNLQTDISIASNPVLTSNRGPASISGVPDFENDRNRQVPAKKTPCYYGGVYNPICVDPINIMGAFEAEVSTWRKTACLGGWCEVCEASSCTRTRKAGEISCRGANKLCFVNTAGNNECAGCTSIGILYTLQYQTTCPDNSRQSSDTLCTCTAGFEADPGNTYCRRIPLEEKTCPTQYPVFPLTGVKSYTEIDYRSPSEHSLNFIRTYRSSRNYLPSKSRLGTIHPVDSNIRKAKVGGWHHNFSANLEFGTEDNNQNIAVVLLPNDSLRLFTTFSNNRWTNERNDTLDLVYDRSNILTGYLFTEGERKSKYYFDAKKNLIKIIETTGWYYTLNYDSSNRLVKVTNHFGISLNLEYNEFGNIQKLIYPDNAFVGYAYDYEGNLTKVTWPDQSVTNYHYENPDQINKLTGITNKNGQRILNITYDSLGKVKNVIRPLTQEKEEFTYKADSTIVKSIDKNQAETSSELLLYKPTRDRQGNPAISTGNRAGVLQPIESSGNSLFCGDNVKTREFGDATSQSYSKPTKEILNDGTIIFYNYNMNRDITFRGLFPATYSDSLNIPPLEKAISITSTIYLEPDTNGKRKLSKISVPLIIKWYEYNGRTLLIDKEFSVITDDTNGSKGLDQSYIDSQIKLNGLGTIEYTYSRNNNLIRKVTKLNTEIEEDLSFEYTNFGQPSKVTDNLNKNVGSADLSNSYDANGRLLKGVTTAGNGITLSYDWKGSLKSFNDGSTIVLYEMSAANQQLASIREIDRRNNSTAVFDWDGNFLKSISLEDFVIVPTSSKISSALKNKALGGNIVINPTIVQALQGTAMAGQAGMEIYGNSRPDDLLNPSTPYPNQGNVSKNPLALQEYSVLRALSRLCPSNCKYYSEPTVTMATYAHLIGQGHTQILKIVPGSRKSYFYSSASILTNAQNIVDKTMAEYFVAKRKPIPDKIISENEIYFTRMPTSIGVDIKGKPTDCVKIVVSTVCRPRPLSTVFSAEFLTDVFLHPFSEFGVNEVITLFPVKSNDNTCGRL